MASDYDDMAAKYVEVKQRPWRKLIEEYSLMKLVGDCRGLRTVDLACGQGYYTRLLKKAGAAEAHGIDISKEMIALAEAEERSDPLGISYETRDIKALADSPDYDLAMSAWLFVYSKNRAELNDMCQGIATRVRSGGRFVTLNSNFETFEKVRPDYTKYGFRVKVHEPVEDGSLMQWIGETSTGPIVVDNHYLPHKYYREALVEAGFRDVQFHHLELSPEATEPEGYWDFMLEHPVAFMIDAIKA
ncbi:MAG: class I SAM-dependent methyltransferase [Verrucomicrobiota bacterium]